MAHVVDTPELILDQADVDALQDALDNDTGVDSPNLRLDPNDIALLKTSLQQDTPTTVDTPNLHLHLQDLLQVDDSVDEGGGSGAPDWVPDGAVAFADFVNGHYWDGTQVVTDPSDMFQSDDVDGDPWDASKIEPGVGYHNESGEAAGSLKGAALAAVLPGFSVVAELGNPGGTPGLKFFWLVYDGNFSDPFMSAEAQVSGIEIDDSQGAFANPGGGAAVSHDAGIERLACTFAPGTELAIALDGSPVGSTSVFVAPTVSVVTFYTGGDAAHSVVRLLAFYPPQDHASLQALSRIIPENAKIHIDLVHQFAWTASDGFVAIDTLLGHDTNTENYFTTSSYNPDNLTADGYIGTSSVVLAAIGAARSLMLSESTFVMRTKQTGDPSGSDEIGLVSGSTLDALAANGYPGTETPADLFSQNGDLHVVTSGLANSGSGAINCFAVTIAGTRAELAFNGSAAATGVIGTDDRPSPDPLNAVAFISHGAIQSITIYDALPSTSGLSELSAVS